MSILTEKRNGLLIIKKKKTQSGSHRKQGWNRKNDLRRSGHKRFKKYKQMRK